MSTRPFASALRWLGRLSFRQRLTLGITLLHLALMSVLVFDLLYRQHSFLHQQGKDHAVSLASTLAVSSASWVMANDVAGLQEVTASVAVQARVRYVMVLGPDMRVLSHSDPGYIGMFVTDASSLKLENSHPQVMSIVRTHGLEDIAAPVMAGTKLIGWARVGIGQAHIARNLRISIVQSLIYILIGSLIAYLFARFSSGWLIAGLERLARGFAKVGDGERGVRIHNPNHDELGRLSRDFNRMVAELENKEARLQQLATTDFLTGLHNRRSFMEHAQAELARLQRVGSQKVALLMLDLDRFKRVNDTYGHMAGDAVLRHVAGHIRHSLREVDCAGRFGGEEFVLLLADADINGACAFAERLRTGIEQDPPLWENAPIPVTVSVGVTVMRADDKMPETAIARADTALYQAKERGRNRVEVQL